MNYSTLYFFSRFFYFVCFAICNFAICQYKQLIINYLSAKNSLQYHLQYCKKYRMLILFQCRIAVSHFRSFTTKKNSLRLAPGQSMERSEKSKCPPMAEGLVYVQKLSKRIFLAIILIYKIVHRKPGFWVKS